jgi:hypothetical protein
MSKTPNYYIGRTHGIEARKVVEDFQSDNYNLGTALTYLMRAGKKPDNPITQDIRKAIAHLEFELERQHSIQQQNERTQPTSHDLPERNTNGQSPIYNGAVRTHKNLDWWETPSTSATSKIGSEGSKEKASGDPMGG